MMDNLHRGEVSFEAENGERVVLCFTINSMCALEEASGITIGELMTQLNDPKMVSLTLMRRLMWAGLIERNPSMTEQQAGSLLQKVGVGEATNLIARALTAAFPQAEESAGNARPQRASRRNR